MTALAGIGLPRPRETAEGYGFEGKSRRCGISFGGTDFLGYVRKCTNDEIA